MFPEDVKKNITIWDSEGTNASHAHDTKMIGKYINEILEATSYGTNAYNAILTNLSATTSFRNE